jgi:hypothetical protein
MRWNACFRVALLAAATATPAFAQARDVANHDNANGGQNDDASTKGSHRHPKKPAKTPVQQANEDAQKAGSEANSAVVGPATQQQNVQKAENPANASPQEKKNDQKEVNKTATDVGHATTTAARVVGNEVVDITQSTNKPGRYDPFAVELDPLGLFVGGRVSLNLEWVPVAHHALVVSPHIVHTSADVSTTPSTTASETFSGFGGELGYRYYTGTRGPNGVFIGPSLILGFYNAGLPDGNQPFTDVGLAVDAGAQWILWDHFVVGGGVGLEYLNVSHDFHDLPTGPSAIASSGVKPRLLLEAGYGF